LVLLARRLDLLAQDPDQAFGLPEAGRAPAMKEPKHEAPEAAGQAVPRGH